eukprot:gene818-1136_t
MPANLWQHLDVKTTFDEIYCCLPKLVSVVKLDLRLGKRRVPLVAKIHHVANEASGEQEATGLCYCLSLFGGLDVEEVMESSDWQQQHSTLSSKVDFMQDVMTDILISLERNMRLPDGTRLVHGPSGRRQYLRGDDGMRDAACSCGDNTTTGQLLLKAISPEVSALLKLDDYEWKTLDGVDDFLGVVEL